jgi:REP element-mobilizing transposase RayT
MPLHKHLARLDQVWAETPVFYVTICTSNRRPELANEAMHDICMEVWRSSENLYGWITGRYVLMPDHVHFFCTFRENRHSLERFVGKWKEWTAKNAHRRHHIAVPLWQPGFFDHVLRSFESYEEKWDYVRQNPVRAALVKSADDWAYQGELHQLSHAF